MRCTEAVRAAVRDCDALVMCAAVADYKPAKYSAQKLKKNANGACRSILCRHATFSLQSESRIDSFLLVGFAAETENVAANAQKKLREKKCDIIVANDVSTNEYGMESAENEVTIFFRTGETKKISRAQKKNIARELVKIISNTREKSLTKKT